MLHVVLHVVVCFEVPIGHVTILGVRVAHSGERLFGQRSTSFWNVEGDCLVRLTNGVMLADVTSGIEKYPEGASGRPRRTDSSSLRQPVVGRREDHTDDSCGALQRLLLQSS